MKQLIAPSLLAADFMNLQRDVEMINQSEADWLHLDIMDGVFVPNISFGFPVLKGLKKICRKPMDVHLMIVEPHKFIREVAETGAYLMNVHYEACIVQDVDVVMLMSVNPGYGGQTFIEHTVEKTRQLREMIDRKGLNTLIEIDGGVNLETGKRLLEAGADVLVAGSFVFKAPDPNAIIKELKMLNS